VELSRYLDARDQVLEGSFRLWMAQLHLDECNSEKAIISLNLEIQTAYSQLCQIISQFESSLVAIFLNARIF
jgi:hypothetical protein